MKKKQPLPYFPFWAYDWIDSAKVRRMTAARKGVFIDLLCVDWKNDGLPEDDEDCRVYCAFDTTDADYAAIVALFAEKHTETGRRTHFKLNAERADYAEFRKKQSERGKKGGRPLAVNPENPDKTRTKPVALPDETHRFNLGNPDETRRLAGRNPDETRTKPPTPTPTVLLGESIDSPLSTAPASPGPADGGGPGEGIEKILPSSPIEPASATIPSPAVEKPGDGEANGAETAGENQDDPALSHWLAQGDTPKPQPVPHSEILRAWNTAVAGTLLPRVAHTTDQRIAAFKSFWAWLDGETPAGKLNAATEFFKRVAASNFLNGESERRFGLDWVIKPANRVKIAEGNYDNRAARINAPKVNTRADHERGF